MSTAGRTLGQRVVASRGNKAEGLLVNGLRSNDNLLGRRARLGSTTSLSTPSDLFISSLRPH